MLDDIQPQEHQVFTAIMFSLEDKDMVLSHRLPERMAVEASICRRQLQYSGSIWAMPVLRIKKRVVRWQFSHGVLL